MSAFKSQVKVEAESGEQVEAESGETGLAECGPSPLRGWIAGKMTSTAQLTDTDVVFPLKANAKIAEDGLRREMRAFADSKGQRPDWQCGHMRLSGFLLRPL